MHIKRFVDRVVPAGLACAVIMGVLSPVSVHAGKFDGVTLTFATWGGSWRKNFETVIEPKFKAEGGTLVFVKGSPQANLAKLIAGRGRAPFDIMEILDAQEKDFEKGDFLQKLDLSKIPNVKYLESNQCSDVWTATWTTQEVICYNTEKYKELGLAPPKIYSDLGDPKLEGRVMIPDITSGGGFANFGGLVYFAGGDENNVQPGLDLIKKLKIRKFWTRGGQTVTEYQTGDIYASINHAGWCWRAKKAGSPVAAVHPWINDQHTGVSKYGWMGIMKSTKDPKVIEAAHWFMNEYLALEYQLHAAKATGVAPVNKVALEKMGDDVALSAFLVTDPAEVNKFLRIDYQAADISNWMYQWNRSISQ